MVRPDLIALTPADLAALTNRSLVKRAQRDCRMRGVKWHVSADGTIRAHWSDGVVCTLPGTGTVREARCSCGTVELCRHVLRTVLAFQERGAPDCKSTDDPGENPAPELPGPWDPGCIDDAALTHAVAGVVLARADQLWSRGIIAELVRSRKPSARFHVPDHTVRFAVPHDLRCTQCSCPEPPPCEHAVLAVRAFRLLDGALAAGIVNAGPPDQPAPRHALDDAENCVRDLVTDGLASIAAPWRDRVRRAASTCAAAALKWPAQILEEMADDFERYSARNAAFAPAQTAARAGELLLRLDAIRAGSAAKVPQAFIRGLASERYCELGHTTLVGLGATVTQEQRSTRLTAYLQDVRSGHVMTVVRDFAEHDTDQDTLRPFHELGRVPVVKGASLAGLAAGQFVPQGRRRPPSGQFIRSGRACLRRQNYAWEHLRPPALVEDFREVEARLKLLPPASFRPRRESADFHICPLAGVDWAAFDPNTNAIVAVLRDPSGSTAQLSHPWTSRGEGGAEALLVALTSAQPRFVAGHVRSHCSGLLIRPTAVVFAGEGGTRSMILPWLDQASQTPAGIRRPHTSSISHRGHDCYHAASKLAAELVLLGTRRVAAYGWIGWEDAVTAADEAGCHLIASVMREVQAGEPDAAPGLLKLLALANDVA